MTALLKKFFTAFGSGRVAMRTGLVAGPGTAKGILQTQRSKVQVLSPEKKTEGERI